ISFFHVVRDYGDKAFIRLHHAAQVNLPDLQAFLPRRTTGAARLLYDRAEEWISLSRHRPLFIFSLRLRGVVFLAGIRRRFPYGWNRSLALLPSLLFRG